MSDGPHRSLPMRRHWKKFAQRAATPWFSPSEVADALPDALLKDFREVPLSKIGEIFLGDGQIPLFYADCSDLLEAVRGTCRGSTAGNILLDCAIEADAKGLRGASAFRATLENALQACARGACHQIEEHYQRKQPGSMMNVRARMRNACGQVPFAALASEMMSGNAASLANFRLTKRSGIDEGPPI